LTSVEAERPSIISRRDGKCNAMFTLRNGIQYKKGLGRERETGWGGEGVV